MINWFGDAITGIVGRCRLEKRVGFICPCRWVVIVLLLFGIVVTFSRCVPVGVGYIFLCNLPHSPFSYFYPLNSVAREKRFDFLGASTTNAWRRQTGVLCRNVKRASLLLSRSSAITVYKGFTILKTSILFQTKVKQRRK